MRTTLLVVVLLVLSGCSGIRFRSPIVRESDERSTAPGKLTPSQIQSEVMTFTDTFTATMSETWNKVAAAGRAESAPGGLAAANADQDKGTQIRRVTLQSKLALVSSALSIASSPNPNVALADMITMVTLERMLLEGDPARELYGEQNQQLLLDTFHDQERQLWAIADRAMTPEQEAELTRLIIEWREANPTATYVASVRLQDFARERQATHLTEHSSGSLLSLIALDPLAGLDPAQRDLEKSRMLGERLFFYSSRLAPVLKWQVESLYQDLFRTPEFKQLLVTMSKVAETGPRIATVAEKLPADVAAERKDALDQLFDKLGQERKATVDAVFDRLAQERTATLDQIDKGQDKLQGSLKELNQTVAAADVLSKNLTTTIDAAQKLADRVMPPPGSPKSDKDTLAEYSGAVEKTAQAADRLSTLADKLDGLVSPPGGQAEKNSKWHAAAADLTTSSKSVVDYAFGRAVVLVVVTPFAVAAAMFLYRWTTRRWRT